MKICDKIAGLIENATDILEDALGKQESPQPAPTPVPKKIVQDTTYSNLYVTKIIEDGAIKCEVVALNMDVTLIHVKILEIKWDRLGTYLDTGKVYPVHKHSGWDDKKIQVWEIRPEYMKRDTSQVILQWEKDIGWIWDLDM